MPVLMKPKGKIRNVLTYYFFRSFKKICLPKEIEVPASGVSKGNGACRKETESDKIMEFESLIGLFFNAPTGVSKQVLTIRCKRRSDKIFFVDSTVINQNSLFRQTGKVKTSFDDPL